MYEREFRMIFIWHNKRLTKKIFFISKYFIYKYIMHICSIFYSYFVVISWLLVIRVANFSYKFSGGLPIQSEPYTTHLKHFIEIFIS